MDFFECLSVLLSGFGLLIHPTKCIKLRLGNHKSELIQFINRWVHILGSHLNARCILIDDKNTQNSIDDKEKINNQKTNNDFLIDAIELKKAK